MTIEKWFVEKDPARLVESCRTSLAESHHALLQPRMDARLRLFACSCSRQVWDLLTTDARSAIQASERFADGRATHTDLLSVSLHRSYGYVTAAELALGSAQNASGLPRSHPHPHFSEFDAAWLAARAVATRDVGPAPTGRPTIPEWHADWNQAFAAARALQADFVRDIFPPPQLKLRRDERWLTSTVLALARQMDASGDFSSVPILADALQDAGCEEEVLLSLCRLPGHVHVRGNWVVDLILGRTGN